LYVVPFSTSHIYEMVKAPTNLLNFFRQEFFKGMENLQKIQIPFGSLTGWGGIPYWLTVGLSCYVQHSPLLNLQKCFNIKLMISRLFLTTKICVLWACQRSKMAPCNLMGKYKNLHFTHTTYCSERRRKNQTKTICLPSFEGET
jgi:hypothetical protein